MKKVVILLFLGSLLMFVSCGSGEKVNSDDKENKLQVEEDRQVKSSTEKEIEESKKEPEKVVIDKKVFRDEGVFLVGKDIPAGQYVMKKKSPSTLAFDYIVRKNVNKEEYSKKHSVSEHAYVTVEAGDYLELDDGCLYKVEDADFTKPSDGIYKDGMYLVGKDIPEGEYTVTPVQNRVSRCLRFNPELGEHEGKIEYKNIEKKTKIEIKDGDAIDLYNVVLDINSDGPKEPIIEKQIKNTVEKVEKESWDKDLDDSKIFAKKGKYIVGDNIEAGKYVIKGNNTVEYIMSSDKAGESIYTVEFLDGFFHLELLEGEEIELLKGYIYKVEDATFIKPSDGIYKTGSYIGGEDIPAGIYEVFANDSSEGGHWGISVDSKYLTSDIASDNFKNNSYVEIKDGQYFELRNATLDINKE